MFKKLLSSQLRINMASGVATTVVNTIVVAIGYPLYLHFLGYEQYGVWLVLGTVLTFAQLGNLGISSAVTKLVAEEYGRGDIEGIQRYITTALAILCLSGTVVLLVILALKGQIIALFKLDDQNAKMALWLLPYVSVLSVYVFVIQVLGGSLSGLGRMDLANYIGTLARIISLCVATVLLCSGFGISAMLIASTCAYLFMHLASFVCIRRVARIRLFQVMNFDKRRCKRLLHFGGGVFGCSIISMLLNPLNKLAISRYAGVSNIPVYEIAFTGSMQVRALFETALHALMPEISRIGTNMTKYAMQRISQIYHRSMRLILFFGIPIYGGLVVIAPVLLRIWLGNRFVETLPGAFRIMLMGALISLLGAPAYWALMGMGRVRHNLVSWGLQSGANLTVVLTSIFLSSTVSLTVVVLSSSVGMGVSTAYLIWQRQKFFRRLSWEKHTIKTVNENVTLLSPEIGKQTC